MLQSARLATTFLIAIVSLSAADPDRDFSGKWLFDADHSQMRGLPGEIFPVLLVDHRSNVHCTATTASGASVEWVYRLDGEDSKYKVGGDSMNSDAKWEGAALLINTLVNGSQGYTIMDRWTLSHDHNQLTIHRQIERAGQQVEGSLLYRRDGAPMSAPPAAPATTSAPAITPSTPPTPATTLVHRPETLPAAPPTSFTIPAGTHILLSLTNPISTKDSKDGDKVYLQTAVPVAQSNQIVIPKGSYVAASISKSKAAGRGSNKGELYILFDSLTLPNGVNRDFHARLTNADTVNGKVDPDEGKISGTGKNTKPGEVGRDVGIGAAGGVLFGGLAGHPLGGGVIGAAAGMAAILASKNKDVVLQRGTSVEMILDRDLSYSATELRH
jgi:hypothetical protein